MTTAAAPLARRHPGPLLVGLVVLWAVVAVASIGLGPVALSPDAVLQALVARAGLAELDALSDTVVWTLRLPRVLLASVVGACLAAAGTLTQGLFRNPLADPGLIGVTGGAAFFAALAIVVGAGGGGLLGTLGVAGAAFVGALATTALVMAVASVDGRPSVATMLLAGIAVQALCSCALSFVLTVSDDAGLRSITFWLMGSLASATFGTVALVGSITAVGLAIAWRLAATLDVLLLGESAARHLGIDPVSTQRVTVLVVACMVGGATALTGAIGFVGLVVPHIARSLAGARHQLLLPAATLIGAVLLTAADTLSRILVAPAELPVGLITSAIGGPFFLFLLVRGPR